MSSNKKKEVCPKRELFGEKLPFAAVKTNGEMELISCNRLGQKLLPPPWKLRRFLKSIAKQGKEERFFLAQWEDVRYFVAVLRETEGYLVAFLEDLTGLREPITRALSEESLAFFQEWEKVPFSRSADEKDSLFLSLAARTFRLRRALSLMQKQWTLSEQKLSDPGVVNLKEFFEILSEKLQPYRVEMNLKFSSEDAVFASSELLMLLILDLIRFVSVYEGSSVLSVKSRRLRNKTEILCSFSDEEGVFSSFADLFEKCSFPEKISPYLELLPLFTLMLLCRENGVGMELVRKEGEGCVIFTLPDGQNIPVAYLETDGEEEKKKLEFWIQRILF